MRPEPCAMDIETTGVGPLDRVTCVAIAGKQWVWSWVLEPRGDNEELWLRGREDAKHAIKFQLDSASQIYTFNGATFDIPFLQREFEFSDSDVGRWMAKLVDPLYAARALLGYAACAKLNDILALNGLQSKTGCGAQAVDMYLEGRYDELRDYCVSDTVLTFELLDREVVYWVCGLAYKARSRGLWVKV